MMIGFLTVLGIGLGMAGVDSFARVIVASTAVAALGSMMMARQASRLAALGALSAAMYSFFFVPSTMFFMVPAGIIALCGALLGNDSRRADR